MPAASIICSNLTRPASRCQHRFTNRHLLQAQVGQGGASIPPQAGPQAATLLCLRGVYALILMRTDRKVVAVEPTSHLNWPAVIILSV